MNTPKFANHVRKVINAVLKDVNNHKGGFSIEDLWREQESDLREEFSRKEKSTTVKRLIRTQGIPVDLKTKV